MFCLIGSSNQIRGLTKSLYCLYVNHQSHQSYLHMREPQTRVEVDVLRIEGLIAVVADFREEMRQADALNTPLVNPKSEKFAYLYEEVTPIKFHTTSGSFNE